MKVVGNAISEHRDGADAGVPMHRHASRHLAHIRFWLNSVGFTISSISAILIHKASAYTETGAHPRRSPGATPQFALSQSGTGQPHGQLFPGIEPARPVVPPIHRSRRT